MDSKMYLSLAFVAPFVLQFWGWGSGGGGGGGGGGEG